MYNNRLQKFSWSVETNVAYSLGLSHQQLLQINSNQILQKTFMRLFF